MKKKIPAVRLASVMDRDGYYLYEPRPVPLLRETLGISQRAELARRAMAEPVKVSPRIPNPPLSDFDDLAAMPGWAKLAYAVSALLILFGLGVMVWASV
jgi:hypothetical protein